MARKYTRQPNSKPPGRPPIPVHPVTNGLPEKEIVMDQVIYWIGLQATAQEIASSFHVAVETLEKKLREHFGESFCDLKKRCDGNGKLSLRRYQYRQSENNSSMAIWLGKQWLGQKDDPSEEFQKTNKLVQTLLDEIMLLKQQRVDDVKKVNTSS